MHGWLGQISGLMQGQQEDAQEYLNSLLRLLALEQADNRPDAEETTLPWRVFGGQTVSIVMCKCGHSTAPKFEPFLMVSLELDEEFTETLEDAFRLFTATEKLDKENKWS